MNCITSRFTQEKQYQLLESTLFDSYKLMKSLPVCVTGICDDARNACAASLISEIRKKRDKTVIVLVHDESAAAALTETLSSFGVFSARFYERDYNFYGISSSREFEIKRLSLMKALLDNKYDVIVTHACAALQMTLPKELFSGSIIRISESGEYKPEKICETLSNIGYVRCDIVDGAGQYAIRGGILDVFPIDSENPVRVEFFGDEVDSISYYNADTQRRTQVIDCIEIIPAKEAVITEEGKKALQKDIKKLISEAADEKTKETLACELDALSSTGELKCADRYISLLYGKSSFLDYIDDDNTVFCFSENLIKRSLGSFQKNFNLTVETMLEKGLVHGKNADYYFQASDLHSFLKSRLSVYFDSLGANRSGSQLLGLFDFVSKQGISYQQKSELMLEDIAEYNKADYSIDIICSNKASCESLNNILREHDIVSVITSNDSETDEKIRITYGIKTVGFELPNSKYVCISEGDSVSVKKSRRSKSRTGVSNKGERILSYASLKVGDYVVHANHGIGIYAGIQTLTFDGVTKDFVKIQYAGKDVIYLPCNQLEMLSKYIGAHSDDGTLKLSKIGGAEWNKTKKKVKAAAKDMAKELIRLYAERTRLPGFAFSKDDEFQLEFEDSFEFEETEGQQVASEEIKRDMEKPYPMDRLLCGDVGFGKTEVAMRAAFKAVMNNKQVAVLVPTTILAMQHYCVFSSRMKEFPVNVDVISRFNTPSQQKKSLMRLKRGETDIIIGTHRLLSKDIAFFDLGLLIIDEEQRFGVAHKEKMKQVSKNIDVLTLSATPIPRTLNMAMSGIRDMSILEEAPDDRYPVQSHVLEYDDAIISEAIKKELGRKGQVFYICNNIDAIDRIAARLQKNFPEARIAAAHGRMDSDDLSDIWLSLVKGEIDILVCTTIIESGVDVPMANTLIVENADRFGLSQLHQIRGRVGRSGRRAYAYFTVPRGKAISEIAVKRLQALKEYTEFGSGFRIALRDLEIRGAGNVLGAEQHGHMDSVGYDLYMKILNEAIIEEQGGIVKEKSECTVEYAKSAYIPSSYISSPAQRIEAYKKISLIDSFESMSDVLDELIDRYGDTPKSVTVLLNVSLIRSLGCLLNLEKIVINSEGALLVSLFDNFEKIEKAASERGIRTVRKKSLKPSLLLKLPKDTQIKRLQDILLLASK